MVGLESTSSASELVSEAGIAFSMQQGRVGGRHLLLPPRSNLGQLLRSRHEIPVPGKRKRVHEGSLQKG